MSAERQVYEFISQKSNDPIVEWKTCEISWENFPIFESDIKFYNQISPIFDNKKYSIPAPKISPDERMRKRMLIRNFLKLYNRKCDATWNKVISIYHDEVKFPVYKAEYRWSDKRSPFDYWLEIDFDTSIFDQLKKLHFSVPRQNLVNINCINSDYCNAAVNLKNSYLVFGTIGTEDSCYGHIVWNCKSCIDCLYTYDSEYCYDCVDCVKSYNIKHSVNVEDCSNSSYLKNCVGCSDCFGCVGLQNKKYHIFNNEYTREEYLTELEKYKNTTSYEIHNKLNEIEKTQIKKAYNGYNCENVFWDFLYYSKNSSFVYDLKYCEDVKYCATLEKFINCQDCNYSVQYCEKSYQTLACNGYHLIGCHFCFNDCSELYYCDNCYSCTNCFGCIWLVNKEYCIFNKQYTKEEYFNLLPKLIEHMQNTWEWWEFFPADLISFGYNESIVQDYYPLTREEALDKWYKWMDKEFPINVPEWIEKIRAQDLPDISNVTDDILNKAIICSISWKPYRIVKLELDFYRKNWLPIPVKHPDVRHKERMQKRPKRQLYLRKCDKTLEEIISVYPPNSQFKVYSESAYNQELYW